MIYFIKSDSGHIKIGYSNNNIEKRLDQLQCACPFNLTLLKTMRGGTKQEKLIHKHFAEFKVRGEWFVLSDEIQKFIDNPHEIDELSTKISIAPKKTKTTVRISSSKIWSILVKNNLKCKDLSSMINLSTSYIYSFMNKNEMQKKYVSRIAEALNIDIKDFVGRKDVHKFS